MRGGSFVQGKFQPSQPQKYIGDLNNIVFRSSYELAFFKFCDNTEAVLKWGSEELVIMYESMVDHRMHRYFTDAIMMVKQHDGSIKKIVVEIKPYDQTQKPVQGKKEGDPQYAERVRTYLVNVSKWEAAKKWCQQNNAEFVILTEKQLFPSQQKQKALSGYKVPKDKSKIALKRGKQ